jgi:hypothetical protein
MGSVPEPLEPDPPDSEPPDPDPLDPEPVEPEPVEPEPPDPESREPPDPESREPCEPDPLDPESPDPPELDPSRSFAEGVECGRPPALLSPPLLPSLEPRPRLPSGEADGRGELPWWLSSLGVGDGLALRVGDGTTAGTGWLSGRGTCSGVTASTTSATAVWAESGRSPAAAAPSTSARQADVPSATWRGSAQVRRTRLTGSGATPGVKPLASSALSAAFGTGAAVGARISAIRLLSSVSPSTSRPDSSASAVRSSSLRRWVTPLSSLRGLKGLLPARSRGPGAAQAGRAAGAASPPRRTSRGRRPPGPP